MNREHVPEELFSEFLANFPQICVEVVLKHDGGILVAKRANEPAKGRWFWPGGRLYKNEELVDAAHRVADDELGIQIEIKDQLGVYAHFWETSDVVGHPSRHTVNVVYLAEPKVDDHIIELDSQHTEYRYLTEIEPGLHRYVTRYIRDHQLLD